jgi:hypothetical protein
MGPKKYSLGGKQVSKATYYRRRSCSNSDASSEEADATRSSHPGPLSLLVSASSSSSPTSSSSSESNMGFPMLSGEDSPSIGKPLNSSPTPLDEFQVNVVDKWAGVGFINGRIPPCVPLQMDLAKAIENKVVSFQGYLDDSNVPITVQGKILEQLFEKKIENQCEGPQNYDGMGLRQLFSLAGVSFFQLLSYNIRHELQFFIFFIFHCIIYTYTSILHKFIYYKFEIFIINFFQFFLA